MRAYKLSFNRQAIEDWYRGPLALSSVAHAIFLVTIGAYLRPSTTPIGIFVERAQDAGTAGKVEAPSFSVDYNLPSDVALPKKRPTVKAKAAPQPAATTLSKGEGTLGNSDVGEKSGTIGDPNGIQVSPKQRYLYELRMFFDQRKAYPTAAKMLGQSGTVHVGFHIHSDGSLHDVKLITPCPHDRLNQAAIDLVTKAVSFKPIPEEVKLQSWEITLPIRYELN